MSEPVISIKRIQKEARAAAQIYSHIDYACPYPFGTDAAHAFKSEFLLARREIEDQAKNQGVKP